MCGGVVCGMRRVLPALVCLAAAGSAQQTVLVSEVPWEGAAQGLSRFAQDPCGSCSAEEFDAIVSAARSTGLGGKGSAACVAEVRTLLCTAWCTPLRRRYVRGGRPCLATLAPDTAVAVCPVTCVALSTMCRAPICGTTLAPFRVVRDEDGGGCVGEPLLSEDNSLAPAAFDIRLSQQPAGDIVVTLTGQGSARCDDTCASAADGICDDDSQGSSLCSSGSDAADCDTCPTAGDGICDDGSLGGETRCEVGTDAADCACAAVVPLGLRTLPTDAAPSTAPGGSYADSVEITFGPESWETTQRVAVRASIDDNIAWHQLVHSRQAVAYSVHNTDESDARFSHRGMLPWLGVVDDDLPGLALSASELHTREGVGQLQVEAAVSVCLAITTQAVCDATDSCQWEAGAAKPCSLPDAAQMAVLLGSIAEDADGLTDQYLIGPLATQPIGPSVKISVTGPPVGGLAIFPAQLEFNFSNWATAQTVSVQAVDNHVADGSRQLEITHTVWANECVAADQSDVDNVALCRAIAMTSDNVASQAACEAEAPDCVYNSDLSYMHHARCLGENSSLSIQVVVDDDDRAGVYTNVVARPVTGPACPISATTVPAGTGEPLPWCRAYNTADRCCSAEQTENIETDQLNRFPEVSFECSQYIDYMLCDSACSASQNNWVTYDVGNDASTIYVCQSLCERLAAVCPGATCEAVLGQSSGGAFANVVIRPTVSEFHPAEDAYRTYPRESGCFGGGLFLSEGTEAETVGIDAHLTSKPTDVVRLSSMAGHAGLEDDGTSSDGVISVAGSIAFGPESQYPSSHDTVPYFLNTALTVSPIDNTEDRGSFALSTIVQTTESEDSDFDGQEWAVDVVVFNDDFAGIVVKTNGTIVCTASSCDPVLSLDETGSGSNSRGAYTIELAARPTADVIVTVEPPIALPSGRHELHVSPRTVTFTAANWNDPQTVSVTALIDAYLEGVHTVSIGHAVSSLDFSYSRLVADDVVVAITDYSFITNATEINIHEGSYEVLEVSLGAFLGTPALSARAMIVKLYGNLGQEDEDDSMPQLAISPDILTFSPHAYGSVQTVVITGAEEDSIDYGHVRRRLSMVLAQAPGACQTVVGSMIDMGSVDIETVAQHSVDCDGIDRGVLRDWRYVEGATQSRFTRTCCALSGSIDNCVEEETSVTSVGVDDMSMAALAQHDVDCGRNRIMQKWQVVIDDSTDPNSMKVQYTCCSPSPAMTQGTCTGHSSTETDSFEFSNLGGYASAQAAAVAIVELSDTDTDGCMLACTAEATCESFALDPSNSVCHLYSVGFSGDAPLEESSSLVSYYKDFGSLNLIRHTVQGCAADELLSQWKLVYPTPERLAMSFTCCAWSVTGGHFWRTDMPANLLSNDKAGVVVSPRLFGASPSRLTLDEGGTSHFELKLSSEPLAPVSITLRLPAGTRAAVTPSSIAFDALNWNIPQQFEMRADENDQHDGDRDLFLVVDATSSDHVYGRSIAPTVSSDEWCLSGGTDCDLWEPLAPVCAGNAITYEHECAARAHCDDLLYVGECDGRGFITGGLAVITFAILDNDVSGIDVSLSTALRTCDVLSPKAYEECGGSCVPRGDCVVQFHASEGSEYDQAVVKLTSLPRGNVTVTLGNKADDHQLNFAPRETDSALISLDDPSWTTPLELVFEPTNWYIPQTVHIGCIDDAVDELHVHTAQLFAWSASNDDDGYNQETRHAANVTIIDNDVALVSVYAPFADTGVTEGTRSSYTMWLETEPTHDVTVTVSGTQVDVLVGAFGDPSPTAEVVFTADSWSVPQEVVIQATDDFDIERTESSNAADSGWNHNPRHHTGMIRHVVSSGDPFYDSVGRGESCPLPTGLPVFVNIVDNDDPRVFLSLTEVAVAEGGSPQMYIVKLLARPTRDVFFDVIYDARVLHVEPAVLTFPAAGWDSSVQSVVSVRAVDDDREQTDANDDIDGIQTATVIEHRVRSEDPFYSNPDERDLIEPPPLVVTVTDNDFSTVLIDPSENRIVVRENGMLGQYNVRLATQPFADVFLYIYPGNLSEAIASNHEIYTVNSSVLIFTEDNWNATQTVLVAAVDDSQEDEMCSAPSDETGPKLPQLVRHLIITEDIKYLPGCGPQQHDCSTRGPRFALQSECEAVCRAPYDPMDNSAPSEKWCGGCLRFYAPSTEDLAAGCPQSLNGTSLPPSRCYKFEPRQGIYYEAQSFPALNSEDEVENAEFNELMRRRTVGDYNTRWATKSAYVVDDDSALLSDVERISDISERTTLHSWHFIPNVTMYAGVPSELTINAFDRCAQMLAAQYQGLFRLFTSDGYTAPRIVNNTEPSQYSVDVLVGPAPTSRAHISLLVDTGSEIMEAPIQGSPIYIQVLPGFVHYMYSYVTGLGPISTVETAFIRIHWFDKFGSPTNLVCRPSRRHTMPIGASTSDCSVGETMHDSVFHVDFLDEETGDTVAPATFLNTKYGWCDDEVREYGYEKPQCLADQAGGSSTVIEYASETPGHYLLQITLDGVPIAGSPPGRIVAPSPYPIVVGPGPTDITQCYAEGTGASNAQAGEQTVFLIKLADGFGNVKSPLNSDPVTFECVLLSQSDSSVNPVVGVVSPQDAGYICVYTVESPAGAYSISVQADVVVNNQFGEPIGTSKRHISTSPMPLDVKPAHPDPHYFLLKAGDGSIIPENPVYLVGDLVLLQVLAMDQFRNPSTELCNATSCASMPLPYVARTTLVNGVEIGENVTVSAPRVDEGIYPLEFTPTIAGVCGLEVVVDGQHIPGSPFQIRVESNQLEPSMSVVQGGGIEGGVAGFPSTFQVLLRDRHGNPVQGEDHDGALQAGILQSNTHCFNVTNETFIPTPTAAGVQDINCTSQDERIKVPAGCSESWQNATPACAIPVDCVGSFSAWTPCSDFEDTDNPRTCGFGTRRRYYNIHREARNGGYECDYSANFLWEEACAINPCEPVTTCVDSWAQSANVADPSESSCELTGNTWSAGPGDPECRSMDQDDCEAHGSQAQCDEDQACVWDSSACTATLAAGCNDQSLDGEAACLAEVTCVYVEDGTCTDSGGDAVVASSQNACERTGYVWDCLAHCEAECSRTGPGMTGQPNEPSVDVECLTFFGWEPLPPVILANSSNTTSPTCTAIHAADCALSTTAVECAAASSALGGGACAWKSDGSCRAVDSVACRTALYSIISKSTFYPELGLGQEYCEAAGDCTYDAGTDNITLTVFPYRQMWCEYCYEVTDSSPVTATALSDGSVHEFQYQVNSPGMWEIVIVMSLPDIQSQQLAVEEVFHFHNIATILAISDATANATTSTIDDLSTSFVNQTFTFHLQARTSQGINLVRGGDPFEVQFGELVLDATNNQDVIVVNGSETVRASFEDSGEGVYAVTVWTVSAGRYDVTPRLNTGDGMVMATYTVGVLPGATDPEHSIVTRTSVGNAGQEMFIEIKARDIFSNDQVYSSFDGPDPFMVVADGPGPVAHRMDNFNTGIYRTRWVATLSGLYTLNISLHSVQIAGSPVQVYMGSAPVSGATSTAAGIGLGLSGGLDADTATSFSVQLRDAFGNRCILVPELMHVALIGSPRELIRIPAAAAVQSPALDDEKQLMLEILSLPVPLFHCDSFEIRDNDDTTINATAFGVIAGFVLNDMDEWKPMLPQEHETGGGFHLQFSLMSVHGLRLVFSNSTTANEDGSRALPTGIHPIDGLVFSCVKPINASLIPDHQGGNHELHYHATLAGSYHLRINYGHELITEMEYPVLVSPGQFNESMSSSSMAYLASNATIINNIDENTAIDPAWPTTMAGRETGFSIIVRDSYSNELTGGSGLLAATLHLKRPRTIEKMVVHSVGGHYFFSSSPTRVGIYVLDAERMGRPMFSMQSIVVVLPADPYGPSCKLQRHGGALLNHPITGVVKWFNPSLPATTTGQSFHLDVILFDRYDNAIDVDFAATGYRTNVSVTSSEADIIATGSHSLTSHGQLIHVTNGNPIEIRLTTPIAGLYTLSIEFVSPNNTSLPIDDGIPWTLLAQPQECVGSWSEFTVQRETDFVAGELFEIGLQVTDAFGNPCTPELLEVSVETTVSLELRAERRLETPAETENREAREAQIINTALQTGFISSMDEAPLLFMEPGRIQWLDSSFEYRSAGHYVCRDVPTVVGQYAFEIKVNNATLWLHVSGRGKTPFELGVVDASTNNRLETPEQIQNMLDMVAVTVRPGPASPYRSFISGMSNTEADVPTRFFVHTMDAFDNLLDSTLVTICTKIVRVDAPVSSSAPKSIYLNAAPVVAETVNAAGNTFNVTLRTTIAGIYQTQIFVFDGGPANIGHYRDCPSLLAVEEEDKYALKPKLASLCPQYNFAQLSEDGLCTSPLAYASDDTAFAVVDTDGDGLLSQDEVSADQAARLKGGILVLLVETNSQAPTYVDDLMGVLDRNADGFVNPEEFSLRWAERMKLPDLTVLPGVATVATSSALGNGLRGGFRGDPLSFTVELRDRFSNLRSYDVRDTLEVFAINVNASALAGVWRRGYRASGELPADVRGLLSRHPGLEVGINGCEVGNCVSTLAAFDYNMFNGSSATPGAAYTETAQTYRQFDSGIYYVTYTPQAPDVYHMCVFVNQRRLPIEHCDFMCSPAVVYLNDELRLPTLLSVTDAEDAVVRAGTALRVVVQLRNEIGYDLNFGGYTGSLIVGMNPDVTKCSAAAGHVDCGGDWLDPIPFHFSFVDASDGSYGIDYVPTLPGHYNLSIMVNLTHESLPVITCSPGLLSCVTRFEPVCGYDLRTYPNECFAQNECIEVAYEGECDYMRAIPIPWIDQPLAEYSVVVLPSGTSPQRSVISIKEAYMCPLGMCYRLKTLRATSASPPRHVGLSTRRSYCDTPDSDLAMHRCPGQTFEFRVQALDSFGNVPEFRPREENFAGSCVGPVVVQFDSRNTGSNGTYFYTAQLTVSGDYVISLTMNGEDVGASSFWLSVEPPHYWVSETSEVVSYTYRLVAGDTASLFLRPRGQYGNALYAEPAPGPLADGSVMLNFHPQTEYTKTVSSWDRFNGTVQVSYTVRASGEYTMNVSFFQTLFADNTINVLVVAGRAVASQCVAYGPGLKDGVAGHADRAVYIDAKDSFGNLVTELEGIENFVVSVEHRDANAYRLWGFGSGFTPLHNGASYVATLADYSPPVYTYVYTALPAGSYNSIVSLGEIDAANLDGEQLVPYRQDVALSNGFVFNLELAPPLLVARLQFRDTGSHIELEFDRPTNKGRHPQPTSCSEVIDAEHVARFGTDSTATCRWQSWTTILITLGPGATMVVGDSIHVKPNVILSYDENSHASSDGAVLAIPASIPAPVVTLAAPKTLGDCDNLLLDASGSFGSGGRAMGFTYTALAGVGANLAEIYEVLHEASCAPLAETPCNQAVISSETLVSGKTYTFTVIATNFWGATNSATVEVTKSPRPMPKVLIAGPTTQHVRSSDTVKLRADVELASCFLSQYDNSSMSFRWAQLPGSPEVELPATFVNSREIQLPKGSLLAGQTYRFYFRGSMAEYPAMSAIAEVAIDVSYSDIGVEILGGSRAVPASLNPMELEVFIADPEDPEMTQLVSYEWSCEPVDQPGEPCLASTASRSQTYWNQLSQADKTLTMPAGVLPVGEYRFTVAVAKDPGFRSQSASAVITLVAAPIMDVLIERKLPVGVTDSTFSSTDRLILKYRVDGYSTGRDPSCTWNVDQSLDLDAEGVLGTTRTSNELVVRPGHLTEPAYTFIVSCVETPRQDDDETTVILATGAAQYTINVNTPPSSGTLRLKDADTHEEKPDISAAEWLDKKLEISAENWVDESAHLPLSYEFRTAYPSTPDREVVLARGSAPTVQARLPAGTASDDHYVVVLVDVSDRYGATSRFQTSIQVYSDPEQASNQATALMDADGAFTTAKNTGDVREMLQLCTILGDLLSVAGSISSGRRLQDEDFEALVLQAIRDIADEARSVPLDPNLIAQYFSSVESITTATHLLTSTAIDEGLDLIELLLDGSTDSSISEAAAIDAATALQNILHALLVTQADPTSSMTSDPADWDVGCVTLPDGLDDGRCIPPANEPMQTRMTKVENLVTRVGLARLPSLQCGEFAVATRPTSRSEYTRTAETPESDYIDEKWQVRNRLFELSSRKLCRTSASPIEVAHEDTSLETNPRLGFTSIPTSTTDLLRLESPPPLWVDSVTTIFYDNINAPSEKPRVDATYAMASLTSPVVSTRLFDTNGNERSIVNGPYLTEVHRGSWSYEDQTDTTTLCVYFQADSSSWDECDSIVSSDRASTKCSCPTTTSVATVRSPSECIVNTNCFTCLSNPKCGWCPGYAPRFSGETPGAPGYCYEGNMQAEFFPGTCGDTPWGERQAQAVGLEVDAWSYDSCPCEAFNSCGDCMLDNDPFTPPEKSKRNCGYCPESKRCLAAADSQSCPDWYVNFVVGMQPGSKLDVNPEDGMASDERPGLYDPAYPRNCPLNCSISWGEDNGYSIPGCVNGVCTDHVNCVCEPGYWSADCSRMCPGGATNPCTGNGQCDAGASGSGQCFCNEGYGGADCADCDSGHWGPECLQECRGGGANPCSGTGICSSGETGTGECTCYRGYYGEDCSSHCPGVRDVPQRICSAHGTCADGPTGDGRCSCWAGYFGSGCEGKCLRRSIDPATGQPEMDEDGEPDGPICSGPLRGVCSDGSSGSGKCQCLPSFYGTDCSGQCPGSTPSGNQTCSGRGVCSDGSEGSGLCRCLDGYRGDECELDPIRVRIALSLDVSHDEWRLYKLDEMLYAGLATALEVQEDVLVPITVLVGADDLTVFFEIRSKGFNFATDILERLQARSETDLVDIIRLPIILPLLSYDHIGVLWPCAGELPYGIEATAHKGPAPPVPPLVDAITGARCFVGSNGNVATGSDCVVAPGHEGEGLPYVEPTLDCNARGLCNGTMGTCVCDNGYAGTDCDTKLSTVARPPAKYEEEEAKKWISTGWWLIVLVMVVGGGVIWYGVQRRKAWATHIRDLRAKPVGLEAAEARHWMSLRRMATGRSAAEAFIVGAGGQTTGPSARNVWDISLRQATPDTEDDDEPRPRSAGLGSGWLAAWPSGGGA